MAGKTGYIWCLKKLILRTILVIYFCADKMIRLEDKVVPVGDKSIHFGDLNTPVYSIQEYRNV